MIYVWEEAETWSHIIGASNVLDLCNTVPGIDASPTAGVDDPGVGVQSPCVFVGERHLEGKVFNQRLGWFHLKMGVD